MDFCVHDDEPSVFVKCRGRGISRLVERPLDSETELFSAELPVFCSLSC